CQGSQAIDECTGYVKEWKPVKQPIAVSEAVVGGRHAAGVQFVAMGMAQYFGQAGGTAGMEDGRCRIAVNFARKPCLGFCGLQQGLKRVGAWLGFVGVDLEYLALPPCKPNGLEGCFANIKRLARPQRNNYARIGGAQQAGNVLGAQQIIDGKGAAGQLCTP